MCFVRFLARKAIKRQLQAAGLKVSHIQTRVICEQANKYVSDHPELIDEAIARIGSNSELRKIAEAEIRRRRRTVR